MGRVSPAGHEEVGIARLGREMAASLWIWASPVVAPLDSATMPMRRVGFAREEGDREVS